jgi:S-sulfo-L-cysteine synthase (3-phospho-L-serine-dependent)
MTEPAQFPLDRTTRWAVFVESETTGHGEEMIHAARRLDLRPVLICADPSRYSFHEDVEIRLADTADPGVVVRAIDSLPQGNVVLVTSTADRYVGISAQVAAALDLRGPDPDAIALCQDKDRQRERLADCSVSVPEFSVATEPEDAAEAADRLGCPVVVKPVNGSGSVGVRLCCTPAQAADHVKHLLSEGTDEWGRPRAPRALVERVVPGREFSVEILAGAIIGITETQLGSPPSFVEVGHDHPAQLTTEQAALLSAEATGAVMALGLARENAHVELRMNNNQVWVIEVNPRLPGGHITKLVKLATGIDMVENHLRHLTGAGVNMLATRHRSAAIRFALDKPEFRPPECAPAIGVVEAQLDLRPTPAHHFGDFRDRIGYVIAVGDDTPTAAARAETACAGGEFGPGTSS